MAFFQKKKKQKTKSIEIATSVVTCLKVLCVSSHIICHGTLGQTLAWGPGADGAGRSRVSCFLPTIGPPDCFLCQNFEGGPSAKMVF